MHETEGILMKQMNARAQLKSLEGANKAEMKGGDGRRNLSDGISNERQEAVGFDQRFLYAEEHPSYEVVQKTKHGRFLRHSAVMIEQRPWLEGQA